MKKIPVSCVYLLLCGTNNKPYIGSTRDFELRKKEHQRRLRRGAHENRKLQRAWRKYGEEVFEFSILETCGEGVRLDREQYWIDYYKAASRCGGYNILPLARSSLGRKCTSVTKAKLRRKALGRTQTPQTVLLKAQRNCKFSKEQLYDILHMRASGALIRAISSKYKVYDGVIFQIVTGKRLAYNEMIKADTALTELMRSLNG